jgi:hypothetical protein
VSAVLELKVHANARLDTLASARASAAAAALASGSAAGTAGSGSSSLLDLEPSHNAVAALPCCVALVNAPDDGPVVYAVGVEEP